jgi:hypothetical protein
VPAGDGAARRLLGRRGAQREGQGPARDHPPEPERRSARGTPAGTVGRRGGPGLPGRGRACRTTPRRRPTPRCA